MTDTLVSQRITLTSIRTKTADHGVKSMKRDMVESLEKRYENLNTCPHYVIYTLLDARLKKCSSQTNSLYDVPSASKVKKMHATFESCAQLLKSARNFRKVHATLEKCTQL